MRLFFIGLGLIAIVLFNGCGGGGGDGLPKTTYGGIYTKLALSNIVQYSYGWGGNSQCEHIALTKDGKVYKISATTHIPVEIQGLSNIKKIAVGTDCLLALDNNGTVYGYGDNYYGQLGLGDTNDTFMPPTAIANFNNIIDISAGDYFGMILDSNNDVYSFGYSTNMGHSDSNDTKIPKKIATLDDKKIIKIFTGSINSLAIDEDGKVYSWGSTDNYNRPILGLDRTKLDSVYLRSQLPQEITTLSDDNIKIKDASMGAWYSLLITDTNEVYGFGDGSYGELGNNDLSYQDTPVKISELSNIKQVSASNSISLFVDNQGNVYSAGKNSNNSALGYGKNNHGVYELDRATKIPNISNVEYAYTDGEYSILVDGSGEAKITQEQKITIEESKKPSACGGLVGSWKRSNGDIFNVNNDCSGVIIQTANDGSNEVMKTYLINIKGNGSTMSYRITKLVLSGNFYNATTTSQRTESGVTYSISDDGELHWGGSTYQKQ